MECLCVRASLLLRVCVFRQRYPDRVCIDDLLSACACDTSAMCYGQYTFVCSSQQLAHTHRHSIHCIRKALRLRRYTSFFPVWCCSTRLCLYLGHPMRTVLFLVLDRPAISQLTYQHQQPANTQCQAFTALFYRSYTVAHEHIFLVEPRTLETISDEP